MAKRACLAQPCPHLVTKGSYCPTHARTPYYSEGSEKPRRKPHTRTATQRGYGAEYKKMRAAFLAYWRAEYGETCANGHPATTFNPLTLDHVVPLSKGGLTQWDNLQALCLRCNSGKRDR